MINPTPIRDLPPRLLQALHSMIQAFEEHNLEPPTAILVGKEIQFMLVLAGARPVMGSWGTIHGVEIRGVWGRFTEAMQEGQSFADLKAEFRQTYRQQFLGEFVNDDNESNE